MMKRLSLVAAVILILLGCGDDEKKPSDPGDVTPPAAVATLAATPVSPTSATLAWKAPGDDGATGVASQYEVRYSTDPITEANRPSAILFPSPPIPLPAGSSQSCRVTGLLPDTTWYFALRTADEKGNWSLLSNVVDATMPADLPDARWWAGFGPSPDGAGMDSPVRALVDFGGRLIAGGRFTQAGMFRPTALLRGTELRGALSAPDSTARWQAWPSTTGCWSPAECSHPRDPQRSRT